VNPPSLPLPVEWSHNLLQRFVGAGDWVIDATVGNGYDTTFLASVVGSSGRVFGFDVQAEAIEKTATRLAESGHQAELLWASHDRLGEILPAEAHGRVKAVLFNLGYLPGADKSIITRPSCTLPALEQAAALLADGGVLVVVTYPGHPGGDEEAEAVGRWLSALPHTAWNVQHIRCVNRPHALPPECWVAHRRITRR